MSKAPATSEQLNEQQERFAVHLAQNGGNATQAAIEAGYSEHTAKQQGYRLSRLPKVQQRVAQECSALMADNVPMALAAQRRLLTTSRSDMVKALVATDMLDRVLGKATQRVDATLGGELTVTIDLS